MAHKPFNLHRRPSKNRPIYYAQFYDELGNRLTAISTGQISKSAAESWAYRYLFEGKVSSKRTLTFAQYTTDFFVYEKCKYIESQLARGESMSEGYAASLKSYFDNHVEPHFKNHKLVGITPKVVEEWLMGLRQKKGRTGEKLSPATINQCLNVLRIVMGEATRLGYISSDPTLPIKQLKKNTKRRGALTPKEAKTLFEENAIEKNWRSDLRHYTINLLAASTGMRMGEIQGLQRQYVFDEYVQVEHSFARKFGLKEPKRNSRRLVPIPPKTSRYLKELMTLSPFTENEDLVFFGKDRKVPIDPTNIGAAFHAALLAIGISEESRKMRNVTFHSWRHFFNSYFRTKIPDAKLQQMTGHKTQEMTDHYTHFRIEDFNDVRLLQGEMV